MAKTALKKPAAEKARAEKKTPTKKKVKVEAKSDKQLAVVEPAKACKVGGCKREYRAKGYCRAHYKKWRQGEFGQARYKACKDALCTKPMAVNRHGLCEDHYQTIFIKGVAKPKPVAAAAPAAAPAPAPKAAANE